MQSLPLAPDSPEYAEDLKSWLKLTDEEEQALYADSRLFLEPYNGERGIGDADPYLYARSAYWTPYEIASLSLGKNPSILMQADTLKPEKLVKYPVCLYFSERSALALRAVEAGQLFEKTPPWFAIAWLERMQISFPRILKETIEGLGFQIADWKTESDRRADELNSLEGRLRLAYEMHDSDTEEYERRLQENYVWQEEALTLLGTQQSEIGELHYANDALSQELRLLRQETATESNSDGSAQPAEAALGPRERNTMLRIIYGMARKGYSYDPTAKKSGTPSEIESDLALLGITLSAATIRKYLVESASSYGDCES